MVVWGAQAYHQLTAQHYFIFLTPLYNPFQKKDNNKMAIKISNEARKQSITSIERYFTANMDESIGNLGAELLLDFILEEIGPSIYNNAVADVQERLQTRVMEVDSEVYETEFQYWSKLDPKARKNVSRKLRD
jgi:uncharacterized protein (DUF2164 family)